jgi:hypothetical protein
MIKGKISELKRWKHIINILPEWKGTHRHRTPKDLSMESDTWGVISNRILYTRLRAAVPLSSVQNKIEAKFNKEILGDKAYCYHYSCEVCPVTQRNSLEQCSLPTSTYYKFFRCPTITNAKKVLAEREKT